jgi:hypothetical protein
MPNLKTIAEFEHSIKENEIIIKKKKKSIPYVVIFLVFSYLSLFNTDINKFTTLFDNQLDFIKSLSYTFITTIILYIGYVVFLTSRLSKQSKNWNISIYKLAKLDETSL